MIDFCYKHGHKTHYCPFKKISPNKLIWVPKGTMINSMQHDKQCRLVFEAPKSKWVPKNYPHFEAKDQQGNQILLLLKISLKVFSKKPLNSVFDSFTLAYYYPLK